MLQKSQFFNFLLSFAITFILGFFIWSAFITPNNSVFDQVLGEVNQIGSQFFPASLPSNPINENIIPFVTPEESPPEQPDKNPSEEGYFDGPVTISPQAISVGDQLDDIQEKLDIISHQVQELIAEQNQKNQIVVVDKEKTPDEEKDQNQNQDNNQNKNQNDNQNSDNTKNNETNVCTGQININTALAEGLDRITQVGPAIAQKIIAARPFYSLNDLLKVSGIGETTLQKIIEQGCAYVDLVPIVGGGGGGGGGGGTPAPNCKNVTNILISEFQVEGETVSDDWVELYNPNDDVVCLSGWSIQKASVTGKISHIKNFIDSASIPAKGYYLIADSDASQNILQIADMSASSLDLSSEFAGGNTIYLAKKSGTIIDDNDPDIVDEVGYGMAKNYRVSPALMPNKNNISTGRIWDETLQEYKDTDSNSADFEIDTPTPRAPNVVFVTPTPTPIPTPTPTPTPTPLPSSDATVTSAIYKVSPLAGGEGTITNVSFGTTKNVFLNNLVFAVGSIENTTSSSLSDPIAINDTLVVTAQDGITTATYTISVATQDTTPPTVLSFYPADNSVDVPVNVQPTLTFSEPLDPTTVKPDNIQLREYATLSKDAIKVSGVVTLSQDGTIVGLPMFTPLQYNKRYYFFVGSDVKDVAGNSFAKNTWYHAQRDEHEFTTVDDNSMNFSIIDTTTPSNSSATVAP